MAAPTRTAESDRKLVGFIENLLVYMTLGDSQPGVLAPAEFSGAFPCLRSDFDAGFAEFKAKSLDINDLVPSFPAIRTAVILEGDRDELGRDSYLNLYRGRQLDPAEKRTIVGRGFPVSLLLRTIEVAEARVRLDGTAYGQKDYYQFDPDFLQWRLVRNPKNDVLYRSAIASIPVWQRDGVVSGQRPIIGSSALNEGLVSILMFYQYFALRRWSVAIKMGTSPSVSFLTDPTGVRSVFALRDVPEGRTRREALSHWVTQHWRQLRSDPDEETKVREHLRGQTEFSWHGMGVTIKIPSADIEKIERLKAQREAERHAGSDRRRRSRLSLGR